MSFAFNQLVRVETLRWLRTSPFLRLPPRCRRMSSVTSKPSVDDSNEGDGSPGLAEFHNPFGKFDQALLQPTKGKVFDKKPFKFCCTEGETYRWCACGWSKSQPFCDDMCRVKAYRVVERPVIFKAPESRHYWFCNCKQTGHRPFCDGTHREDFVQAAVK